MLKPVATQLKLTPQCVQRNYYATRSILRHTLPGLLQTHKITFFTSYRRPNALKRTHAHKQTLTPHIHAHTP